MSTSDSDGNVDYYEQFARDYALFFSDLDRNMEEEGAWLDAVLRGAGVRTVLDASCGSGRQAIPLAARGYTLHAADPSAAMLREAEIATRRARVQVSYERARFDQLPSLYAAPFDAVIALGNGLCNLESAQAIGEALTAMRRCCRTGGICLVGMKDFRRLREEGERFHGHTVTDRGPHRTILFEVWDFEESHLVVHAFIVEGEREAAHWPARVAHTREYMLYEGELRSLARGAGFGTVTRLDHPSELVFRLSADS